MATELLPRYDERKQRTHAMPDPVGYCEHCGEELYAWNDYWEFDGEVVCWDHLEEYLQEIGMLEAHRGINPGS